LSSSKFSPKIGDSLPYFSILGIVGVDMKLLLSSTDLFDSPLVRLMILLVIGLIVLLGFIYYVIKTLHSKAEAYEEQVEHDPILQQLDQDSEEFD
jgi:hypothetical protein